MHNDGDDGDYDHAGDDGDYDHDGDDCMMILMMRVVAVTNVLRG